MGSCRGRPLCLPAEGVGWRAEMGKERQESREKRREERVTGEEWIGSREWGVGSRK